jgi:hypothetical protein
MPQRVAGLQRRNIGAASLKRSAFAWRPARIVVLRRLDVMLSSLLKGARFEARRV